MIYVELPDRTEETAEADRAAQLLYDAWPEAVRWEHFTTTTRAETHAVGRALDDLETQR